MKNVILGIDDNFGRVKLQCLQWLLNKFALCFVARMRTDKNTCIGWYYWFVSYTLPITSQVFKVGLSGKKIIKLFVLMVLVMVP